MTTQSDIRAWLERGKDQGAAFMLVVCDTFDHEDYPVYVSPDQDIDNVAVEFDGVNMQRIMESYCLSMDWAHLAVWINSRDWPFQYLPQLMERRSLFRDFT